MYTTPPSLLQRLHEPANAVGWRRFVDMYSPLLIAWTRKLGIPTHDAADLMQDVFTSLLELLPTFTYQSDRSFRAWMKTVLVNRWRTWQRRQVVRKAGGNSQLDYLGKEDDPPAFEEDEYRRYLVVKALEIMQNEFQPVTWKACWEYVVGGRDPESIASELGITVNAVYLAKSRVLRKLRQELAGLLD